MRERSAAKQGGEPFAALYADPDRLRQFLSAMTGITSGTARVIAAKFPCEFSRSKGRQEIT